MSHVEALSQWKKTVSTYFGHLSGPQARGLALWSFGMVLAKSCGITSVVGLLAPLVESSESNVRQQLREWCSDAKDKKGEHRLQIEVDWCFAPLLCWILSWWAADERRVALAMDASNLTDRFSVLCLSVVYRGCAIPVAWKIIVGNAPGSWEPYWKSLFTAIHSSVPTDWTVIVRADRGLYAKWLYHHLVSASLASVFAHQRARQSTTRGRGGVPLALLAGACGRQHLGRSRRVLCGQAQTPELYALGVLRGGVCRPVAHRD